MRFSLGHDSVFNLVPLFDLRIEKNFPTLYSTLTLGLAAAFNGAIALDKQRKRAPYRYHWWLLAIVFAFLACDEFMTLHERAIPLVRSVINAHGVLYFAWVVPYAIVTFLFGLAYIPFLRHLPTRTAVLFIGAGAVFVAGAIGFESLSGAVYESTQSVDDWRFILYYTLEELLEMIGIAVFVYALSEFVDQAHGGLGLTIRTHTKDSRD